MPRVELRAYASLNDFLARPLRHRASAHEVERRTSVKDFLERIGIPHVEIDLLVVNGEPAGFSYLLQDADRVAAFPRFFSIDVEPISCVRAAAAEPIRFVLDVHLGGLARRLRLAGLDVRYSNNAYDEELASIAEADERVLLTRDVGLLKRRAVARGYFVRSFHPHAQFVEVLRRFAPLTLNPFRRCLRCGADLEPVAKAEIVGELPPRTRDGHDEFRRCTGCGRLFWKGTHYGRLVSALARAVSEAGLSDDRW